MRHNGQPTILASTLPPHQLSLRTGEAAQYVCRECGRWTLLRRSIAMAHRAADGIKRCPGSGQRVTRDVTSAHWLTQLAKAERDAALLRTPHVHRVGKPSPPPAVCQLAAAR